jgi:hypothetical protein
MGEERLDFPQNCRCTKAEGKPSLKKSEQLRKMNRKRKKNTEEEWHEYFHCNSLLSGENKW